MQACVTKILDFPAAHRNTRHDGHCNRVHGHTWTLEITVKGKLVVDPEQPDYGMVVDFQKIKDAYKEKIEPYVEHHMLNETLPFLQEYTTEVIAGWIFNELKESLPNLHMVRLWEGKSSYVDIKNGDVLR